MRTDPDLWMIFGTSFVINFVTNFVIDFGTVGKGLLAGVG